MGVGVGGGGRGCFNSAGPALARLAPLRVECFDHSSGCCWLALILCLKIAFCYCSA